ARDSTASSCAERGMAGLGVAVVVVGVPGASTPATTSNVRTVCAITELPLTTATSARYRPAGQRAGEKLASSSQPVPTLSHVTPIGPVQRLHRAARCRVA